jgi:hypothetical protein
MSSSENLRSSVQQGGETGWTTNKTNYTFVSYPYRPTDPAQPRPYFW